MNFFQSTFCLLPYRVYIDFTALAASARTRLHQISETFPFLVPFLTGVHTRRVQVLDQDQGHQFHVHGQEKPQGQLVEKFSDGDCYDVAASLLIEPFSVVRLIAWTGVLAARVVQAGASVGRVAAGPGNGPAFHFFQLRPGELLRIPRSLEPVP